jgi:hypothetical protein
VEYTLKDASVFVGSIGTRGSNGQIVAGRYIIRKGTAKKKKSVVGYTY